MSDDHDEEPGEPIDDGTDARVADGVEHLQRAAHEMIAAARTFLDVVEEVVGDNAAFTAVADAFGTWGQAMSRAAGRAAETGGPGGPDEPDDGTGRSRVQHIDLS
jgi:hypothetical protein